MDPIRLLRYSLVMFNMGFTEILLLGIIALVVIGPKQLPEVAKVIASFYNELKRATQDLKDSISQVDSDVKKTVGEIQKSIQVEDPEAWIKEQARKVLEEREKSGTLESFEQTKDITEEQSVSEDSDKKEEKS